MRVLIVGDVHGQHRKLAETLRQAQADFRIGAAIQVGDFGFYRNLLAQAREELLRFPVPMHAIDGNHEDHAWLRRALLTGRRPRLAGRDQPDLPAPAVGGVVWLVESGLPRRGPARGPPAEAQLVERHSQLHPAPPPRARGRAFQSGAARVDRHPFLPVADRHRGPESRRDAARRRRAHHGGRVRSRAAGRLRRGGTEPGSGSISTTNRAPGSSAISTAATRPPSKARASCASATTSIPRAATW
jgi:hypothetical protein